MADYQEIIIGNVKGPKGDPGDKGEPGKQGADGVRGSKWFSGVLITGTSTTPTAFAESGIVEAFIDDFYINTDTGNIYRCTTGGDASSSLWVHDGNIMGPRGETAGLEEELADIISGEKQVGDANKLGGHAADEFLQKTGGTLSGSVAVSNGSSAVAIKVDRKQSDNTVASTRMWTGTDKSALFALYDGSTGTEITRLELRDGSVKARIGNVSREMVHTGNVETLVTPSRIGAAEDEHNQSASTITAGTLGGKVNANATAAATLSAAQVRDIYAGTADAKAGTSSLTTGTIYAVYE